MIWVLRRIVMKCPKCQKELVQAQEQRYRYIEPFVPARDHCPEHGYQPVAPKSAWKFHSPQGATTSGKKTKR